jgi:hypothetical protein
MIAIDTMLTWLLIAMCVIVLGYLAYAVPVIFGWV